MTSIAEKYAAQWLPNGEVSLADLIQAAVDEAVESRRHEVAMHAVQQIKAEIGQFVPVVGEAVAWVAYTSEGGFRGITLDVKEADRLAALEFYVNPLVHISKDYVPAAELAELREKAAMVDELRKLLEDARDDVNSVLNDILVLGNYPHNERRIRIQQELLAAIDAAIAQEKGE